MEKLATYLVLLFLVIPCQARIITVDDNGPADFNNIQAAIDDANDGDEIVVAEGTYTGLGNRDIDFGGKSIVLRSLSGSPLSTTIDCEGLGRAFDFHSGETPATAVIGFTITNGYANYGGAIRCEQSNPQIRDCVITGNTSKNAPTGSVISEVTLLPSLKVVLV